MSPQTLLISCVYVVSAGQHSIIYTGALHVWEQNIFQRWDILKIAIGQAQQSQDQFGMV